MRKNPTWRVERAPEKDLIIELIHEDDFSKVPDGTELYSIFGRKVVKGVDEIDTDTRGGYLAFGKVLESGGGA